MGTHEFIKEAKDAVVNYYNSNVEITDKFQLTPADIFVVWSVKVLQNNKALLSTTVSDGMYYEVTHNGDKNELYLDAYKKWQNIKIELGEK